MWRSSYYRVQQRLYFSVNSLWTSGKVSLHFFFALWFFTEEIKVRSPCCLGVETQLDDSEKCRPRAFKVIVRNVIFMSNDYEVYVAFSVTHYPNAVKIQAEKNTYLPCLCLVSRNVWKCSNSTLFLMSASKFSPSLLTGRGLSTSSGEILSSSSSSSISSSPYNKY